VPRSRSTKIAPWSAAPATSRSEDQRAVADSGRHFSYARAGGRQRPDTQSRGSARLQADVRPPGADQVRQLAPVEQRLPRALRVLDLGSSAGPSDA